MGDVGGDWFLEGRVSDRIEGGNDQSVARRVYKNKTATAKSAVEIPNVSRRRNARAVGISRSGFWKWESFRRYRAKRKISQWEGFQRQNGYRRKRFQRKRPQRKRFQRKMPEWGRSKRGIDSDNDEEMEEETSESNQK